MRGFRCTKKGHRERECRGEMSCSSCSGRHFTFMCDSNWKPPSKCPAQRNVITCAQGAIYENLDRSLDTEVLVQTFRIPAVSKNERCCYIRAIIDGGSQRTFIHKDMSRKLKLMGLGQISLRLNALGNAKVFHHQLSIVQVRRRSQYDETKCLLESVEIIFIRSIKK